MFNNIDIRDVSFDDFEVKLVPKSEIHDIVKELHYSQSVQGTQGEYCFGLYYLHNLVGAAMYGRLANPKVDSRFISNTVELRKFVCVDNTPRNTESWFLARTIKYLRKNTDVGTIVSYADPNMGHEGTIYKAANFKYEGLTASSSGVLYNNRLYHQRCLYNRAGVNLKKALDEKKAKRVDLLGKHRYTFTIS